MDVPPNAVKTIKSLRHIAADLRDGKNFNITRLTMLKGLCEDSDAATQFALFLAKKSPKAIRGSRWLSSEDKRQFERLASKAVRKMAAYLKEPSEDAKASLWELLTEIRNAQNEFKRLEWGPVRLIESRELFVVELATECVLYPKASSDLGYRIARYHAERYDPTIGTGLVPASASAVEDITEFWGRHFFSRGWRRQLGK